jgi:hypothetical protein
MVRYINSVGSSGGLAGCHDGFGGNGGTGGVKIKTDDFRALSCQVHSCSLTDSTRSSNDNMRLAFEDP